VSNIAVQHAPSGLIRTFVVKREQVTPHLVRVTFGGGGLEQFEFQGFDQWFRLAVPTHGSGDRFDNLPKNFGIGGYLRYLLLPGETRPVIRNYTVRAYRSDPAELDVDFVVHGTDGIAAPWAAAAAPGAEIAFIDQGRGWKQPVGTDRVLLVADESGLPAAAGILRDLPRETVGDAVIELFDDADRQDVETPDGVTVHWVVRDAGALPGTAALPALAGLSFDAATVYGFAVGESAVATGARRLLVSERGVPKAHVTFCGYWKVGRAAG
jgi:NADPH-dependent ferric siderophore reductase